MATSIQIEQASGEGPVSLVASDSSIEDALEPVKLLDGIGKGGCDVGSRLAVQALSLD